MSADSAVPAGERWRCPVCKHDHEMFDEEHVASCLTCPCEHRYLDNVTEPPTTLARLARDCTVADGDPLMATSADMSAMFKGDRELLDRYTDALMDGGNRTDMERLEGTP